MSLFKKIFEFYIDASIHVALAVYAFSWITLKEFNLPYSENILYFIFFGSITGYNFIKYYGAARFHHRRLVSRLKMIQIFSLLVFLIMCYYAFSLDRKTLSWISILAIITFLYAIPFLPNKYVLNNHKSLRSISGVKIYIIALVWAGVTVLLPIINASFSISHDVIITFIQRFLLTVVLILPFDIRDMQYDSLKLSTIPQIIGIQFTKQIGAVILFVFFFMEFLKDNINYDRIFVVLIVTLVTLILLVKSQKQQHKYYSSFWVEGLPILWLLLLCFISNFS